MVDVLGGLDKEKCKDVVNMYKARTTMEAAAALRCLGSTTDLDRISETLRTERQ